MTRSSTSPAPAGDATPKASASASPVPARRNVKAFMILRLPIEWMASYGPIGRPASGKSGWLPVHPGQARSLAPRAPVTQRAQGRGVRCHGRARCGMSATLPRRIAARQARNCRKSLSGIGSAAILRGEAGGPGSPGHELHDLPKNGGGRTDDEVSTDGRPGGRSGPCAPGCRPGRRAEHVGYL